MKIFSILVTASSLTSFAVGYVTEDIFNSLAIYSPLAITSWAITVEYADLMNKVQSILDYIGSEDEQLKNDREWAMKSNEPIAYQMINNNIKQKYVIESTLLAIRRDIENMHDDIQTNIKQEKKRICTVGKLNR